MHLNRVEEKELWLRDRYKKEFADLHELCEKIFWYSSYLSTSGTRLSTSGLSMQPHSVRVGNNAIKWTGDDKK